MLKGSGSSKVRRLSGVIGAEEHHHLGIALAPGQALALVREATDLPGWPWASGLTSVASHLIWKV